MSDISPKARGLLRLVQTFRLILAADFQDEDATDIPSRSILDEKAFQELLDAGLIQQTEHEGQVAYILSADQPTTTKATCGNCLCFRWFVSPRTPFLDQTHGFDGYCQRFPRPHGGGNYPAQLKTDWCFEHKPQLTTPAADVG